MADLIAELRARAEAHGGDKLLELAAAALEAARDGFVLVPVDPTPEMVKAAEEAYMPFGDMELAIQMAIAATPREVKDGE